MSNNGVVMGFMAHAGGCETSPEPISSQSTWGSHPQPLGQPSPAPACESALARQWSQRCVLLQKQHLQLSDGDGPCITCLNDRQPPKDGGHDGVNIQATAIRHLLPPQRPPTNVVVSSSSKMVGNLTPPLRSGPDNAVDSEAAALVWVLFLKAQVGQPTD